MFAHFKVYLGATADGSVLDEECTILTYGSTELTCSSAPASRSRRRNLNTLITGEGSNLALLIPTFQPTGGESVLAGVDGPSVGGEEAIVLPTTGGSETIVLPAGSGGESTLDPVSHTLSTISDEVLAPLGLQTIDLCIAPAWAGMCDNDPPFEVSLVPTSLEITQLRQHNNPRPLRVVDCDETSGCIKVKYGGAYSGNYTWDITSTDPAKGKIVTDGKEFRAVVEVTDVTPAESSVLGGAELTLTGQVFQEDIDKNIVKVGAEWWSGIDHYCYLTEVVSPNQIKCRLPYDGNRETKAYDVIYFMSTYEEGN